MPTMEDAIKTDAGLLSFSSQFSTKISLNPTSYGLTAANATSYQTAKNDYATKYAAAVDPATRGEATIFQKDLSRSNLVALTRQFARQIQGTMTVTDAQRQELGLTVKDVEPSPIPAPSAAPGIDVVSTVGNTVKIRLHDTANPTRRGKPPGVDGASVFSFVGANAPTTEEGWKFEGVTSRTKVDIVFPSTVAPGSRVWFTAFWFNERKQNGPAATPVGTNIPGGGAMAA